MIGRRSFITGLVSLAAFSWGASAAEISDQFARPHDGIVELCRGNLWEKDTERGSSAAVSFGQYVKNGTLVRCGGTGEFCGPNECYFVGTQIIDADGKFHFYNAPTSAYPSNMFMLGDGK